MAKARIVLERGRVFMQAGDFAAARPLFYQSYELCAKYKFEEHAVNAAHMIAILGESPAVKIEWNERAIQLAETSEVPKAKAWLGSLFNNLAQPGKSVDQWIEGLPYFCCV